MHPTPTPDDPGAYERDLRAATEDLLRRVLNDPGVERQDLREVRLEGSYPNTEVVVTIRDTRRMEDRRAVTIRREVWALPHYRPEEGILEPPDQAAQRVVRGALGEALHAAYSANPEPYEQRVLATTKHHLQRAMPEREELRDVRLEGSHPDTRVVVTIWDARNPASAREHVYKERIWASFSWVSRHGIDPPEQTGSLIAMHALGG